MATYEQIAKPEEGQKLKLGTLAIELERELKTQPDAVKQIMKDEIEDAVHDVAGKAFTALDEALKNSAYSLAAKRAVAEIDKRKSLSTHPRLIAEKEVYQLKDWVLKKYEKDNYRDWQSIVQEKHSWSDGDESKPYVAKRHTAIMKSLLLQEILADEAVRDEAKEQALLKETADTDLLTYQILYMLDKKSGTEEEKKKIKAKFDALVQSWKKDYKAEDKTHVQIIEEFYNNNDWGNDPVTHLMLRQYVEEFGNMGQQLDMHRRVAEKFKSEPWFVYDYLQKATSAYNLMLDMVGKDAEKTKKVAEHAKNAISLFFNIQSQDEKKTARYNRNAGHLYFNFGFKTADFEKSKEYYKKANELQGAPILAVKKEINIDASRALEDFLDSEDKKNWQTLLNYNALKVIPRDNAGKTEDFERLPNSHPYIKKLRYRIVDQIQEAETTLKEVLVGLAAEVACLTENSKKITPNKIKAVNEKLEEHASEREGLREIVKIKKDLFGDEKLEKEPYPEDFLAMVRK
jgi:hypothetical protein